MAHDNDDDNNQKARQERSLSRLAKRTARTSVIVVGAPASGAGKTTVACGLLAACAARGLAVRCCKTGPDFLDGMQHRAALEAGRRMCRQRTGAEAGAAGASPSSDETKTTATTTTATTTMTTTARTTKKRQLASRTANLDGWMQGDPDAVRSTFLRHLYGDVVVDDDVAV